MFTRGMRSTIVFELKDDAKVRGYSYFVFFIIQNVRAHARTHAHSVRVFIMCIMCIRSDEEIIFLYSKI